MVDVGIDADSTALDAFTTGNPLLGTNLLKICIGRDSAALKGLSPELSYFGHGAHAL